LKAVEKSSSKFILLYTPLQKKLMKLMN
jgi:hypothetical protein